MKLHLPLHSDRFTVTGTVVPQTFLGPLGNRTMHAILLICVIASQPATNVDVQQPSAVNEEGATHPSSPDAGYALADNDLGPNQRCSGPGFRSGGQLPSRFGPRSGGVTVWRHPLRHKAAAHYFPYRPTYNYLVMFDYPWHPTRCSPQKYVISPAIR